jgi:hypothetical protein
MTSADYGDLLALCREKRVTYRTFGPLPIIREGARNRGLFYLSRTFAVTYLQYIDVITNIFITNLLYLRFATALKPAYLNPKVLQ